MSTRLHGVGLGTSPFTPRGSVEMPPASGERASDVLDAKAGSIGLPRDADHVEPHGPIGEPAGLEPPRRGAGDVLPLLPVHRRQRGSRIAPAPQLHLDEHDRLALAGDQIQLAASGADVSVKDLEAARREKGLGHPLAHPCGSPLPLGPIALCRTIPKYPTHAHLDPNMRWRMCRFGHGYKSN